jgi:hypothetical protein
MPTHVFHMNLQTYNVGHADFATKQGRLKSELAAYMRQGNGLAAVDVAGFTEVLGPNAHDELNGNQTVPMLKELCEALGMINPFVLLVNAGHGTSGSTEWVALCGNGNLAGGVTSIGRRYPAIVPDARDALAVGGTAKNFAGWPLEWAPANETLAIQHTPATPADLAPDHRMIAYIVVNAVRIGFVHNRYNDDDARRRFMRRIGPLLGAENRQVTVAVLRGSDVLPDLYPGAPDTLAPIAVLGGDFNENPGTSQLPVGYRSDAPTQPTTSAIESYLAGREQARRFQGILDKQDPTAAPTAPGDTKELSNGERFFLTIYFDRSMSSQTIGMWQAARDAERARAAMSNSIYDWFATTGYGAATIHLTPNMPAQTSSSTGSDHYGVGIVLP